MKCSIECSDIISGDVVGSYEIFVMSHDFGIQANNNKTISHDWTGGWDCAYFPICQQVSGISNGLWVRILADKEIIL